MPGKLFERKHKRGSRMYCACVRSTSIVLYTDAPQDRDQHAANICTIIVQIDERQSRKGVVNYVHNFQLLWLYPFLQRTILRKAPNLSRRGHFQIYSSDTRITSRMGIVSFVFVVCSALINKIDWPTTKQKIAPIAPWCHKIRAQLSFYS